MGTYFRQEARGLLLLITKREQGTRAKEGQLKLQQKQRRKN